jgi:hypothetical protein
LFRQLPDYIFIAASRPTLTGEPAMLPCLLPRAEPQIPVASVRFFGFDYSFALLSAPINSKGFGFRRYLFMFLIIQQFS